MHSYCRVCDLCKTKGKKERFKDTGSSFPKLEICFLPRGFPEQSKWLCLDQWGISSCTNWDEGFPFLHARFFLNLILEPISEDSCLWTPDQALIAFVRAFVSKYCCAGVSEAIWGFVQTGCLQMNVNQSKSTLLGRDEMYC